MACRPAGADATPAEREFHLAESVRDCWLPAEYKFVDQFSQPITGTFDKNVLREWFDDVVLEATADE